MPTAVTKKLVNIPNRKDSEGMPGMLALHVDMRFRLLDAPDEKRTLVKDVEAEVVGFVPHAFDEQEVHDA